MKNVTITPPDELARRARVAAARQRKICRGLSPVSFRSAARARKPDKLAGLRKVFHGPGYPAIAEALARAEALQGEREEELLRRFKSSRLRDRSGGAREARADEGFKLDPDVAFAR